MGRPKKQINRKNDIIEAAQKLFSEKGFEKTTMEEIAREVGISKASIYLDFKNKDDITLAIAKKHFSYLLNEFELFTQNLTPPYLDGLKKIIILDSSSTFDLVSYKMNLYTTFIHCSYYVRMELNDMFIQKYRIAASILEKAANNGEINTCDNYFNLATLVYMSLQGFFPPYVLKYSAHYRTELSKEELKNVLLTDLSSLIDVVLSGLKSQKNKEEVKMLQ